MPTAPKKIPTGTKKKYGSYYVTVFERKGKDGWKANFGASIDSHDKELERTLKGENPILGRYVIRIDRESGKIYIIGSEGEQPLTVA